MYELNLIHEHEADSRRRVWRLGWYGFLALIYLSTLLIVQYGAALNDDIRKLTLRNEAVERFVAEKQSAVERADLRRRAIEKDWSAINRAHAEVEGAPSLEPVAEFLWTWFDRPFWREVGVLEALVYHVGPSSEHAPGVEVEATRETGVVHAIGLLTIPEHLPSAPESVAKKLVDDLTRAYRGLDADGEPLAPENDVMAPLREASRLPLLESIVEPTAHPQVFRFRLRFAAERSSNATAIAAQPQ